MFKRIFDILFSLFSLFVAGIPMLIIAAFIKIVDGGPVLYKQVRIGKDGKEFKIVKFRTMVVNADRIGAQITVGNDPRITPVGRLLRRTKFDELPQLFNVLVGTMSFVGPRPEVPKYVALYDEEQKKVLSTKPGITDLASIKYLQESEILSRAGTGWEKTYLEQIMPDKLRLNLEYLRKRSLQIDISLVFKTLLRFFTERLVVPKRDDRQRLRRVPKKNVMTLESNPMGEFFRRLGHRVVSSESSWWHEVQPHVFQSFPYHHLIQPEEAEIQALIREYHLRTIRYTTPLEGFGFFSAMEINTDTDYDISNIRKTEVRRAIRHGLENFKVQQIDSELLYRQGLALNRDTANRQGRQTIYTHSTYWHRYCRAIKDTPNVTVWGAMRNGQLASYMVTVQFDGWSNWLLTHSLNSMLRIRPSNAIYYVLSKYFLVNPGGYKICHGLGSLEKVPTLDTFKRNMGVTFQPVKQRLVFSDDILASMRLAPEPVLKVALNLLPKNYSVRKTAAMFRLYRCQTSQLPEQNQQETHEQQEEVAAIKSQET